MARSLLFENIYNFKGSLKMWLQATDQKIF